MNETMVAQSLANMALFTAVVEEGSFSAAGRKLGIPKATVSRRIAQLEAEMGTRLLNRSTRSMVPTETGRRYFERIRPLITEAAAAHREFSADHAQPAGLIRISAPTAWGQAVLAPRLHAFLRRFQDVRIDLVLTDDRLNVVSAGLDVAVRIGDLEDSDLIQRRIGAVGIGFYCAPEYLKTRGTPRGAGDLSGHDAILTRPQFDRWIIGETVVRPRWRIATGTMPATLDACVAGFGIARMPKFLAQPELEAGRLVPVLKDVPETELPVSALWSGQLFESSAVALLLADLVQSDAV
ncbi:LysR substrate-binding domain-containing protein [Leisingera sp. D0M16]|uniref:LysR family transcriptional regulator n=1 Tax=Leisingera coralii TaxID=3351347 RepID=UPI003B7B0FF6